MASQTQAYDPRVSITFSEDSYGGVIVNSQELPKETSVFKQALKHSMQAWKEQGKGGVWLKLPVKLSAYVPIAIETGFTYHHAEPKYVMLTAWLRDTPNSLPARASHQVGVGVFVQNSKGEMLVVQEKNGPAAKLGIWKVPTGLLDPAEDFTDAAVREVREETGLEVVFDRVLCMRQAHGFLFGNSDLFLLCAASLDTSSPSPCSPDGRPLLKACEKEIAAARWMDVEEYCSMDFIKAHAVVREFANCMREYQAGTYRGLSAFQVDGIRGGTNLLAHGAS